MEIAAYLPPNLLSHLIVVVGGAHRLIGSESWDDLAGKIRSQPIDMAVLDPMADGEVRLDAILAVLDEFPSVPVILYSQLYPENLQATVDLARAGVRQVVLYRYDDGASRFLELIESQPGAALAQMLIKRLEVPLNRLKPNIRRTVERMFGAPAHFQGVPDLAVAAKVGKRTIYRVFRLAGLASPRRFVAAARLLRAYAYMLEPGNTLEIVANKLGYSMDILRRLVDGFAGMTPRRLKKKVTPEDFVKMIADELYPSPGDTPPE